MANKDGTGPRGKGPLTGRGMGNCTTKKSTSLKGKGKGTRGKGLKSRLGNMFNKK